MFLFVVILGVPLHPQSATMGSPLTLLHLSCLGLCENFSIWIAYQVLFVKRKVLVLDEVRML